MQLEVYSSSEIIALITSMVIGSIAYLGIVWKDDPKKITFGYVIAVICINSLFVWVTSELMRVKNWGQYRTTALPFVAFLGQWIADYIKTKYPKIFDAGFKKAGLDLDINNKNNEDYEELHNYKEGDSPEDY